MPADGGTDELPATINAAAAEPGTHILVACSGGQGAPLDALLCCQQRGDVLWLWGARTREERRGAGLAQLLLVGGCWGRGAAAVSTAIQQYPQDIEMHVLVCCSLTPAPPCAGCLQEEAEALARSLPGVASLLSVTVPANDTMLRLFARCGFRQQCEVVSWPATDVCVAAHRQLQEPRQQQGGGGSLQVPEKQAGSPQQATMLSILPKTAAVVDNAAARQLLPHWRRCLSPHHLTAVLLLLRQQRTRSQVAQLAAARPRGQQRPEAGAANSAAEAAQAVAPLAADSAVFAWLPAEYEVVPAMHPTVQQLIADGGVWLLETATPQGTSDRSLQERAEDGGGAAERPGPAAVLVLWGAGFRGVRHAGVVAGSAAALDSALLCAAAADPACCRWGAACGCRSCLSLLLATAQAQPALRWCACEWLPHGFLSAGFTSTAAASLSMNGCGAAQAASDTTSCLITSRSERHPGPCRVTGCRCYSVQYRLQANWLLQLKPKQPVQRQHNVLPACNVS